MLTVDVQPYAQVSSIRLLFPLKQATKVAMRVRPLTSRWKGGNHAILPRPQRKPFHHFRERDHHRAMLLHREQVSQVEVEVEVEMEVEVKSRGM